MLRRKPDLVFLDFSANDGIFSDNPETLASYEAIVRRLIQEAGAPVVQVLFPFQWDAAAGKLEGMKRREAHLALAHAYGTAAGDAIALAQERVRQGKSTLQQIWPVDGVHPGDAGYTLFADAAWLAFQQAVREKKTCTLPEKMLYAPTYLASARVRLSSLGPLPEGWRVGAPNVVSAYFDMLMSRWLDDEVIASNRRPGAGPGKTRESVVEKVAPLRLRFRGSMVMLFGESTMKSGKYRAFIDGQLVEHREGNPAQVRREFDAAFLANLVKGNTHLVQVIAEGLDPKSEHILEIVPLLSPDTEQELRLESICVAGGVAKVRRTP